VVIPFPINDRPVSLKRILSHGSHLVFIMNPLEELVRMKSLNLIGLMALAAASMYGQPTNGAPYWSSSPPDCTAISSTQVAVAIKNPSGTTIGFSCYVTGTFVWLAAGQGWTTAIRVAGPGSGSIGVDYQFFDANGDTQSMDFTGSVDDSGDDVNFALFDNQPSEIVLIGDTNHAPHYNFVATGSVYATFYCPDASTCLDVTPQLIYSALPSIPWSLSVPIAWDTDLWHTWSAVGTDNAGSKLVSFVVYNQDVVAHRYAISAFDVDGNPAGTGFTPPIPPLQSFSDGSFGEGGTYGALIGDVLPNLPAGTFKFVIDGGSQEILSSVSFLQFDGPSATSLQVAFDTPPGSAALAKAAPTKKVVRRVSPRQQRTKATSKPQFKTLPRKTASR
jgi:hypothetical protein